MWEMWDYGVGIVSFYCPKHGTAYNRGKGYKPGADKITATIPPNLTKCRFSDCKEVYKARIGWEKWTNKKTGLVRIYCPQHSFNGPKRANPYLIEWLEDWNIAAFASAFAVDAITKCNYADCNNWIEHGGVPYHTIAKDTWLGLGRNPYSKWMSPENRKAHNMPHCECKHHHTYNGGDTCTRDADFIVSRPVVTNHYISIRKYNLCKICMMPGDGLSAVKIDKEAILAERNEAASVRREYYKEKERRKIVGHVENHLRQLTTLTTEEFNRLYDLLWKRKQG